MNEHITLKHLQKLAQRIKTEISASVVTGRLQRKKVENLAAIDPAAKGADKYIYMVPKTDPAIGDQYDEYMVLDGVVEYIGSTAVNLSGYVEKEEGKSLSSNDFTDEEKAKLADIKALTDIELDAMLDEVPGDGTVVPE